MPVSTNNARGFDRASVPYADYEDWRNERDVFAHVAVWRPVAVDVAGVDQPERVEAAQVSNEFFDVLGVTPMVGRTFDAAGARERRRARGDRVAMACGKACSAALLMC